MVLRSIYPSATSDAKPWAIGLTDQGIRFGRIGGLHRGGIPLDPLLQTQRQIADQQGFGVRAGVGETRLGVFGLAVSAGLEPLRNVPLRTRNRLLGPLKTPASCFPESIAGVRTSRRTR